MAEPGVTARRLGLGSLVLGLGSLVLVLVAVFVGVFVRPIILTSAILAVVCGHMARARFKKLGTEVTGRRIATAGLVLGYLPLGAFVGTVLFLFMMIVFGQESTIARWIYSHF